MLVSPHGSVDLKPLLLPSPEVEDAVKRANRSVCKIQMTSRELSDLLMLGMGAYTPLDGFMGYDDWRGVCEDMKLRTGVFWPIPITLSVNEEIANNIKMGDDVALTDDKGRVYGQITAQEIYQIDKAIECNAVFGTVDINHPGVAKVMEQAAYNLSGPVKVFDEGDYPKKNIKGFI